MGSLCGSANMDPIINSSPKHSSDETESLKSVIPSVTVEPAHWNALPQSIKEEITDYIFTTFYDSSWDGDGILLYSASSDTWRSPCNEHGGGQYQLNPHSVMDMDRNIRYCDAGDDRWIFSAHKGDILSLNLVRGNWCYERIAWNSENSYGRISCMLIVDSKVYLFYETKTCIVCDPFNQKDAFRRPCRNIKQVSRKVKHGIMVYGSKRRIMVEKAVYVPSEHSICIISVDGDRIQFTSWSLGKRRDRFAVKAVCDHGRGRDGPYCTGGCKYATLTEDERFIICVFINTDRGNHEPNILVVDRKNEYKLTECKIPKETSISSISNRQGRSFHVAGSINLQYGKLVPGFCRAESTRGIPREILNLILKWFDTPRFIHFFNNDSHFSVSVNDIVSSVKRSSVRRR